MPLHSSFRRTLNARFGSWIGAKNRHDRGSAHAVVTSRGRADSVGRGRLQLIDLCSRLSPSAARK